MDVDVDGRSSSSSSSSSSPTRERVKAASSSATQLSHEASLTGHVSQPLIDDEPPRSSNRSRDYTLNQQHLAELLPTHPFNLNFPTLNTDGSVDDLTSHQSRLYPTPPAALSTLGAKTNMASRGDASESESSSSDGQFEIISHDELSETSSDEHDTASIVSNDDGDVTPEYIGSDDEQEHDHALPLDNVLTASTVAQEEDQDTPPSTAASFVQFPSMLPAQARVQQMRSGNDSIDSYMSEDLETPRQSTMPAAMPVSQGEMKHILFFSFKRDAKDISQQDMDLICSKVAACMHAGTDSMAKVVRLPLTPTGIAPSSATVVSGQDTISATIQHCVGVERRTFGSYALRILDCDGKHSNMYTVGGNRKIDLLKPDIAIMYVDKPPSASGEMALAYQAVRSLRVPIVIIHEPIIFGLPRAFRKGNRHEQMTIEAGKFLQLDRTALKPMIQRLVDDGSSVKRNKSKKPMTRLLTVIITVLMAFFCLHTARPITSCSPAVYIPIRREALVFSLQKATTSKNVSQDYNIEQLVPMLPSKCYSGVQSTPAIECELETRVQGVKPNHMVLALPGTRHFPKAVATEVYKSTGRRVDFNQTRLIDGIYLLTLDPAEAYGIVKVTMLTNDPQMNATGMHDFGRQLFKPNGKASTDVSKAVSKDVALVRNAAKILSEKFSTELSAGMWATKNVTSQLAVYVARELQVFGGTAFSILGKAANATNHTASTLTKDLVLMQQDIVKYTKELTGSVKSQLESAKSDSKALIRSRLSRSRERIGDLKKAILRKRNAADTRLRNKQPLEAIHKEETAPLIGSQEKLAEDHKDGYPLRDGFLKNLRARRDLDKAEQELQDAKEQLKTQMDHSKKSAKAQLRKELNGLKLRERTLKSQRRMLDWEAREEREQHRRHHARLADEEW